MAFTYKIKHGFAGFEKYLYLPTFSINADDFLFRKLRIRSDKRNPILTIFLVSNADDLGWDMYAIFFYLYIHGEKIFAPTSTLFIHSVNLIEVHPG